MENIRLDLYTNEVIGNPSLVGLLNGNSTHLTNHIGKNYATWHFNNLETPLKIIISIQREKLSFRLWKDENLDIVDGDEWEV